MPAAALEACAMIACGRSARTGSRFHPMGTRGKRTLYFVVTSDVRTSAAMRTSYVHGRRQGAGEAELADAEANTTSDEKTARQSPVMRDPCKAREATRFVSLALPNRDRPSP